MKAVIYTKYGGPEVLQILDVEQPIPKDDEVLIRVHAVSLNDWDWGLMQGDFVNRMMYGLFKPGKKILGSDIAGRIEAIGKNVKLFQKGDEVYGDLSGRWGGLAEYVAAPENAIARKPASMSFETAAAIPQAGMLAVQGLLDYGQIQQGQKILINGAGGGVGSFAVQIGKLYGAEITGVDSAGKLEMMRELGFDHVIDYRQEDFTRSGKSYDLILDVKTNRSVFDYLPALSLHGVYVTVGGSLGRLLQAFLLKRWISSTRKKQIKIVVLKPNKDLAFMNELFEAGKLKAVIDGPYCFGEVSKAFRIFASAEHKGKLVISI